MHHTNQSIEHPPTANPPDNPPSPLLAACREGTLSDLAEQYVADCRLHPIGMGGETKGAKVTPRFPNAAGFCRFLHCGTDSLDALREEAPGEYAKLQAIFEDEALNSFCSPTLLAAYLKQRLYYGKDQKELPDGGGMQICFEHDIWEDGE